MYCGNCGQQIADNQLFCPYCGSKTKASTYTNVNASQMFNQQGGTFYSNTHVKNYNLISAYTEMFKNYAKFEGRSRRSEYWYAVLANWIIVMVVYMILFIPIMSDIATNGEPTGVSLTLSIVVGLVLMVYAFASLVPSLALGVRRLHDIGKSGWYMLMGLIPYVGSIILIVFMATDSQKGPNQYGSNPKGM